jgi:uncharacterized protein YkwD
MGLLGWLGRLFGPRPAPAPIPTPMPAPDRPTPDTVESSLLDMFNSARKSAGLAPLVADPRVMAAAEEHATMQASVNRMAHDGIGDGEPSDRLTDYGYRWSACAENVAWGQSSPAEVFSTWMASPPHRANIRRFREPRMKYRYLLCSIHGTGGPMRRTRRMTPSSSSSVRR